MMQMTLVVVKARRNMTLIHHLYAHAVHAARDAVLSPALHLLITVDGRRVMRCRAAEVGPQFALVGVSARVHDCGLARDREFEAQKVTVSVAQHIGRAGLPRKEDQGSVAVVELVEAGLREDSLGVVRLVAVDVAAGAGERSAFLGDPIGRVVEEGSLAHATLDRGHGIEHLPRLGGYLCRGGLAYRAVCKLHAQKALQNEFVVHHGTLVVHSIGQHLLVELRKIVALDPRQHIVLTEQQRADDERLQVLQIVVRQQMPLLVGQQVAVLTVHAPGESPHEYFVARKRLAEKIDADKPVDKAQRNRIRVPRVPSRVFTRSHPRQRQALKQVKVLARSTRRVASSQRHAVLEIMQVEVPKMRSLRDCPPGKVHLVRLVDQQELVVDKRVKVEA